MALQQEYSLSSSQDTHSHTHLHTGAIFELPILLLACFLWEVGQNQRTQRKPTWTWKVKLHTGSKPRSGLNHWISSPKISNARLRLCNSVLFVMLTKCFRYTAILNAGKVWSWTWYKVKIIRKAQESRERHLLCSYHCCRADFLYTCLSFLVFAQVHEPGKKSRDQTGYNCVRPD